MSTLPNGHLPRSYNLPLLQCILKHMVCRSETKFDSGCGWPAFYAEIKGAVNRHVDVSPSQMTVLDTQNSHAGGRLATCTGSLDISQSSLTIQGCSSHAYQCLSRFFIADVYGHEENRNYMFQLWRPLGARFWGGRLWQPCWWETLCE